MEKVRALVLPEEFGSLKVAKSTLETIRLEGELRDRCRLDRVLARLQGQQLSLPGFSKALKVRVAEAKDEFPTRHSWDSYFRDARHMNELKPGERPDTVHVCGLPTEWFSDESCKPSEAALAPVFAKWGRLRRVDVPAADPYRSRMRLGPNIPKFSYDEGLFFDAYVQYVEYVDFVRAMDALRGMKLLKKEPGGYLTASLKVDFDKTKHMSDASVSHREFERKRLIAQDSLAAEKLRKNEQVELEKKEERRKKEEANLTAKESRRRKREEKRKRKALTIFRKQEEDKVSLKIAREERKLIKAQRQLESIRLLDSLFDRLKVKVEKKELEVEQKPDPVSKDSGKRSTAPSEKIQNSEGPNGEKKQVKGKGIKKKRLKKEKKKQKKRKKGDPTETDASLDSASEEKTKKKLKSVLTMGGINSTSVTEDGAPGDSVSSYLGMYPRIPQAWYYDASMPMLYPPMSRGLYRGHRFPCRIRGQFSWRGNRSFRNLNSRLNEQYYKYFASLTGQKYHESDYEKTSKSRSRSREKSRSSTRSRSRSRSKSRSRTRTRSRSRSRGRRRSISRTSRSRRRSRSTTSSRSRSKSRSRSRTYRSRRKRRTRSGTGSRNGSRRNRGYKRRSSSKVKVTRARSCTASSKRKSRSGTPVGSKASNEAAKSVDSSGKVEDKGNDSQRGRKEREDESKGRAGSSAQGDKGVSAVLP
ncbi:A-kinase anchor protein 17A isoform X2 [Orussus abietinus]|nr:A-kinase anchor protein 17A isoform X2 [Orussus abietinus]XP_012287339.1 A-kinase anchor protein 17A isoform X2 [Orussus abietinus]XP_023289726.1 A-kinase anchor protein 17A isoform X2 [Orussus abietinus]